MVSYFHPFIVILIYLPALKHLNIQKIFFMNRRVLPKYCFSIAKVVVTSFAKLVHIYYPKWLGECSSLRTQRCKNNLVRRWNCKLSSFTRVTSCESYGSSLLLQADLIINITKGDNRCSLFGIHSNILGSSLLVFLCRALIASFLSRSTLTWLCLQTINYWFLFLVWASNPYHTMYKISQELRKLPFTSYPKVKFKCQKCLSRLS